MSLAITAIVYRTTAVVDTPPVVSAIAAVIAYGLVAGISPPLWALGHVLVVGAASGTAAAWLIGAAIAPSEDFGLREGVPYFMTSFVPLLGLTLAASTWQPMRSLIEYLQRHAGHSVVGLNLLNAADALFTEFALRSGNAIEANPFIRLIGLPVKIILVAVASAIIYRLKPRALVWPALALFVILAYHLSGFIVRQ